MAARTAAQRRQVEVIDLVSTNSDEAGPAAPPLQRNDTLPLDEREVDLAPFGGETADHEGDSAFFDAFAGPELFPLDRSEANDAAKGEIVVLSDGEEVFIPDEDEPEVIANPSTNLPGAIGDVHGDADLAGSLNEEITADTCLKRVLEIFPDVSHEHVINLYDDQEQNADDFLMSGAARLDNIIDKLVSEPDYPKEQKGKQSMKKRKREDSIDDAEAQKWEKADRETAPSFLKGSMQAMLKAEYPEIPVKYINDTLAREKHFYQAYVALAKAKDHPDPLRRAYSRGRPSTRHLTNADTMAANAGWPGLVLELTAARKRVEKVRAERAVEDAKKSAEEENLRQAMERGETAECQACFDDLPMNRQVHCDGPTAHFTCYDCITTYIKTEVGESRCRVLCTAGCGATFAPNQLQNLSDKQLHEKLAELEQEKAIRDAGLEDLEECPFCDYKAILPPIDEDFEFRCANPECEKVSCRRCKSMSHVPISCEQHAKDNKINSRHKIEEAMTAALVRSCNKCKKQFIKEYGCNKMSCPSCGNLQCYVCSQSLKNYDHFDHAQPGRHGQAGAGKKCPLYDNVEERHEREVKAAEEAAKKQLMEDNPDITADDLEIKLSDNVKRAEADRIRRAGGGPPGLPLPNLPALNDAYGDFARLLEVERLAAAARRAPPMRMDAARQDMGAAGNARPHVAPPPQPPAMQGFIPVLGFHQGNAPAQAPGPAAFDDFFGLGAGGGGYLHQAMQNWFDGGRFGAGAPQLFAQPGGHPPPGFEVLAAAQQARADPDRHQNHHQRHHHHHHHHQNPQNQDDRRMPSAFPVAEPPAQQSDRGHAAGFQDRQQHNALRGAQRDRDLDGARRDMMQRVERHRERLERMRRGGRGQ